MNVNITYEDIKNRDNIYLYAGDMPLNRRRDLPFIGLSQFRSDKYHIKHDITNKIQLNNDTVDVFQSEDVMEHIEYGVLPGILNEIHRILKPNGVIKIIDA